MAFSNNNSRMYSLEQSLFNNSSSSESSTLPNSPHTSFYDESVTTAISSAYTTLHDFNNHTDKFLTSNIFTSQKPATVTSIDGEGKFYTETLDSFSHEPFDLTVKDTTKRTLDCVQNQDNLGTNVAPDGSSCTSLTNLDNSNGLKRLKLDHDTGLLSESQQDLSNVNSINHTANVDTTNVHLTETSSDENPCRSNENPRRSYKDFNIPIRSHFIYNILTKSHIGWKILQSYELDIANNDKAFSNFKCYQFKLCHILIDNEFFNDKHDIYGEDFCKLRNEIMKQFPKALKPIDWYVASSECNKEVTTRGSLYHAYLDERDDSRKRNIFFGTIKQSKRTGKISKTKFDANTWNVDTLTEAFKVQWQSDISSRLIIKKKVHNFEDLYIFFPCLKCFDGYHLILSDFNQLFPNNEISFSDAWSLHAPKIICIANRVKSKDYNKNIKHVYDEIVKYRNESNVEVAALFVTALLIKIPPATQKPLENVKIDTKDCQKCFLIQLEDLEHLETPENFERAYSEVQNIYSKTQESIVQPFVAVCGSLQNITAVYLIVSKNYKYRFSTVCEAIDVAVKAHRVFNLPFSRLYRHIMQFFDCRIYKINTGSIYKTVSQFDTEINNLD